MFWGGDNRRPIFVTFSQLRAGGKNIGLVDVTEAYCHLGFCPNIFQLVGPILGHEPYFKVMICVNITVIVN